MRGDPERMSSPLPSLVEGVGTSTEGPGTHSYVTTKDGWMWISTGVEEVPQSDDRWSLRGSRVKGPGPVLSWDTIDSSGRGSGRGSVLR